MTDQATRRNIRAATIIWMASVLLSRVMGFVREIVIARQAGANAETDVYFAAFTIPDFVNYLLAGGALSITFIPIFAGYLAKDDEAEGWRVFSTVTTFVGIALLVVIVPAMIFTERLTPLVASGFTPEQQAQLARLTRIVLPAQFFHFEGFLLSAVQMAKGRHRFPALSPLIYNAGIILGGLLLGPSLGMEGFSWGVLGGAFAGSFLLQLYGASRIGLQWSPRLDFRHPGLRKYLKLSLPIMVGQSLVAWDEWLTRQFGSFLTAASISWLNYGRKLAMVPQAVFGQAASLASYPHLARLAAQGRVREVFETLTSALKGVLVMALGTQVFLMVLAGDICFLLFRSDRFSDADVASTAQVLLLFSLGIAAWSAQGIVARGYYAFKDTLTPTLIGTGMTLLSVPVYYALSRALAHQGLALGSTLAITVYAVILYRVFLRKVRKLEPGFSPAPLAPFLIRLAGTCLLAGAITWAAHRGAVAVTGSGGYLSEMLEAALPAEGGRTLLVPWVLSLARVVCAGVAGVPAFVLAGLLFGIDEVLETVRKLAHKTLGGDRAERLLRRLPGSKQTRGMETP